MAHPPIQVTLHLLNWCFGCDQVTLPDVENAPTSDQEGPFAIFSLSGSTVATCRWVALPQWKALSMARHPVAIEVSDCSKIPAIVLGLKARSDDERKRLQSPGLLVFDIGAVSPTEATSTSFYLSPSASSNCVEMVDGANLMGSNRQGIATLLFLCR